MVKNDLIDRYIYAVTKHMKSAMKKDVAAELETIIQDKIGRAHVELQSH